VVGRIADDLGLQMAFVPDAGIEGDMSTAESDWILLAEDRRVLDLPLLREATAPMARRGSSRTWTDDYSNILQVMSFGRARDE
jgi:hypothetical protein